MRTIAILGATGSIGTQALDIVRRYPERFRANCLTANASSEKLFELVRRFRPDVAALNVEPDHIPEDVRFCQWFFGPDSTVKALEAAKSMDALCAIVGIAGLDAVWTALDVCQRVLLANKEALVTGGGLVMEKARRLNKPLLPVDSEHSAIFQCLQAANGNPARRLILTCSGGALRTWDKARMEKATVGEVLSHPTWNMGGKITVDCATLLNKGFEVIEAHHLFSMPLDGIDVVVHPQSIVHSLVEFTDNSVLAQLGYPDMRGPIGYAMGFPERLNYGATPLDLAQCGTLTFERPDRERFPCLDLAIGAQRAGGVMPVTLNAANEAAVAAFLEERVPFGAIARTVAHVLEATPQTPVASLEDVFRADAAARRRAEDFIGRNLCS